MKEYRGMCVMTKVFWEHAYENCLLVTIDCVNDGVQSGYISYVGGDDEDSSVGIFMYTKRDSEDYDFEIGLPISHIKNVIKV